MDGARDTVLKLQVHLRDSVVGEDGGIRDITWRSMSVSHVYHPNSFLNSRIAADSTMFRIVNLLMALSFGVHLEQLLHLTGLT